MTTLFQKNLFRVTNLALCFLCLVFLTLSIAQDNADSTDTSSESTSEIATETNVEEATESETTGADAELNSEASTTEEATKSETTQEGTAETASSTEAEPNTEDATEDAKEETSEETSTTSTETTSDNTTDEASAPNQTEDSDAETTEETATVSETPQEENTEDETTGDGSAEDATTEEISTEEAVKTTTDGATEEASENPEAADETSNERVITVEYSGGNRKAIDFRYGPWIYTHPDEEGIVGTVGTDENSQLTIYAQEAELKAPEDVLIATAGERTANFTGGVRVARKRLTALGESLEYSEETGFGELAAEERVEITVLPKESDGDLTEIKAASATFDVDTDVSVSRGDVTLESGTQSAIAEEITFEQGLDLAVITSPDGQVTVTRTNDDGELVITADTVRVLTETKKLMASGNVTLVDGAITTTGEVVFFDDDIDRAEVFGTPDNLAVSIDSEFDVTIKGERLEQLIDLDLVEILDETVPDIWDEADFLLSSEASSE